MERQQAISGYIACLLKFPDETDDQVLDRFFTYYRSGLSTAADLIAKYAYAGVAMTPRMFNDQTKLQINQDGLSPNSISVYADALGESVAMSKLQDVGRKLLASNDMATAMQALAEAGTGNDDTGAALNMPEHLVLGNTLFYERQDMIRAGMAQVRFPWVRLNDMLPYIYQDDMIILSGDSKVGKSSAAHQIALRNARNIPVVYFHNEDNPLKLHMRRLAQMQIEFDPGLTGSGLNYVDLVRSTIKSDRVLEEIERTNNLILNQIGDRITYVYCSGWTPERICGEWARLRRMGRAGLVIIDYLNKIEFGHLLRQRGNSPAYALDYTAELIKREAGRSGQPTPCILVQQENPDGTVRDSKSTYIKAQAHISLKRSKPGDPGDEIRLLRANDGETGSFGATFFPKYMLWVT